MQRLIEKTDFKNIAILILINLIIGIYLIATTVLISKDGTTYINCARQFSHSNLISAISNIETAPGYPFLIFLMHGAIEFLTNNSSIQGWILSAQLVSLSSKLLASNFLYFIGIQFIDQKKLVFWGIVILSILPDSAKYGSDALTEWPQLMFLSLGFLMLLLGATKQNYWIFGLVGIISGLGYLIRSESCQLMIYGGVWLAYSFFQFGKKADKAKIITSVILLILCFGMTAIPYMKLKGYVFPDQRVLKLGPVLKTTNSTNTHSTEGFSPKTTGNKNITKNICETLVYYFVPALLIGGYYYFRKYPKYY